MPFSFLWDKREATVVVAASLFYKFLFSLLINCLCVCLIIYVRLLDTPVPYMCYVFSHV